MASLFACRPDTAQQTKSCVLFGVSQCRDQVSHVICNAHASIFGLINKTVSYHDGENNQTTKIVTYISASNNVSIPLFMDSHSKISIGEIQAFAINACNLHPEIKVDKLASQIACLMGVNMRMHDYCPKSWFDDANSALIIRNSSGKVQYFKSLPQLHKCLFYFVNASNIRHSNISETYLVPNLSLTRNDSSDTYSFIVPRKNNILKYTNHPDCVATPVVLDGIREVSQHSGDKTFTQIGAGFNNIC